MINSACFKAPLVLSFNHSDFITNNAIEKRCLSYADTIYQLVTSVFENHQPADKVLASYFREYKKHGSKDRKIIRETLFAVFRWWGWLRQSGNQQGSKTWLGILATTAALENHPWLEIRKAWENLCNLDISTSDECKTGSNFSNSNIDLEYAKTICKGLLGDDVSLELTQLAPEWFWPLLSVSDNSSITASLVANSFTYRPPIWARAQQIASDAILSELNNAGINASACDYFDDAINLGYKNINLNGLNLYQQGYLEIQDLASQVIGQICNPQSNQLWWDACSGAGGKSLQLSSLIERNKLKNCKIIASDIRPKALEELKKRYKRANFTNISIKPWHSDSVPVPFSHFDGVLVDAPCSCSGTWRRNPDMRWIDDVSSITKMPDLQLDILTRSSKAVKVGGTLIYATCSLAELENDDVVNRFLSDNKQFELQTLTHPFTGKESQSLTIWPFEANSDGMFVAKMKRVK